VSNQAGHDVSFREMPKSKIRCSQWRCAI